MKAVISRRIGPSAPARTKPSAVDFSPSSSVFTAVASKSESRMILEASAS
ncbi:hypothetical protein ACFSKJ_21140 [Tabrizicola soli]